MKHATHSATLGLIALVSFFVAVESHDGVDHGAPETVAPNPGSTMLAATGSGALYEGILKAKPFSIGEPVGLTLYLVSLESNRPITGATVHGNLSDGHRSIPVEFQPTERGLEGIYTASVTLTSGTTMSWLFDVTAGSDSDLIAVAGFQSIVQPSEHDKRAATTSETAVLRSHPVLIASVGGLLLLVTFLSGRLTMRKHGTVQ